MGMELTLIGETSYQTRAFVENIVRIMARKKMTRLDACVLNRLAQLVSGPGAVDVVYKGIAPEHVDDLARRAVAG